MSKNTQLGNLVNGIFVDSTGRVGVGTQSPSQLLEVNNATSSIIKNVSGTRALTLESYAADWNYLVSAGNNLAIKADGAFNTIFFTNGAERMRITSAGDVGIGTSSPSRKLEVNGSIKAVGAIVRESGSIFVGSYVTVFTMDTSTSKVYLLQLVPTDSAANTSYRLFGIVQANTAAGSSGYAFVSLASQTMDVQFVGAAIQVRITNGQGYNFNWSITQLV
jgi:hypothetical protein